MKKVFLLSVILVFCMGTVNSQGGLNGSINAGIPVGDAGDFASFSLLLDLDYLFEVSEAFQVGPGVGFSTSFLKSDFDGDNISFLPITANGRFVVSENITVGADLGYGVGINEGNEGGFYFAPKVQHKISDKVAAVAAYRSISENGGSFNMITFGILINLIDLATKI